MLESTPEQAEPVETAQIFFPALTAEVALYTALAAAAFFIRFLVLDGVPLSTNEAQQALAAWHFVQGTPGLDTGSPLLFTGNAILFGLFGATDLAARFLPALAGALLVLVPYLLREPLGRVGALVSSALLVFSPSLVFASRELDGAIVAVTCALAAFAFAWRYLTGRAARDADIGAALFALTLLAAPAAWTAVLAIALFAVAIRLRREQLTGDFVALRRAALVFVLVFVGIASGFLLHRDGVGAGFALFGVWLNGLGPGGSLLDPLRLLALYDPIILFFGAIALIDLVFSARQVALSTNPLFPLGLWSFVGFVVYTIGGDKSPTRVVMIVAPLALVAGWYIGAWWTRLSEELQAVPDALQLILTQEGPVFFLACALAAFLYFLFAEFALHGGVEFADTLAANFGLAPAAATGFNLLIMGSLILVGVLAVAFLGITMLGFARTQNLGIAIVLTLLSAWTFRSSVLLNFTLAPNVREWLVPVAGAPNVRDMVRDVEDASRWATQDSHTIVMVVDPSLGPQVEWYLREFRYAQVQARPAIGPDTQALLLSADAPAPGANWISQRYDLELIGRSARPPGLLSWLLFRDVGDVQSKKAALWLPAPK